MSPVKSLMMMAAAMLFASSASAQAPVEFDFTSEGAPALNGIGTSYTVDGITLSADAEGPEFANGQPTGETIALNTFISDFVGGGRLVIDNQTITDSEFDDLFDDNNEDAFISGGETLTLSFDTAVQVTSIDFFGVDDDEVVTVAVGANDSFEFSTSPGDVFENPFGTLVIAAGTDLTFNISGSTPNNAVRYALTNIVVTESTGTPVTLGDVNCDGEVNFGDIAPFIALLSSGGFKDQADVDVSGEVDFADIAPFIAILAG